MVAGRANARAGQPTAGRVGPGGASTHLASSPQSSQVPAPNFCFFGAVFWLAAGLSAEPVTSRFFWLAAGSRIKEISLGFVSVTGARHCLRSGGILASVGCGFTLGSQIIICAAAQMGGHNRLGGVRSGREGGRTAVRSRFAGVHFFGA